VAPCVCFLSGLLWLALLLALLKGLIHWEWKFDFSVAIPMLLAAIFLPFIARLLWAAANRRQGISN
jgi:hypothetical protein